MTNESPAAEATNKTHSDQVHQFNNPTSSILLSGELSCDTHQRVTDDGDIEVSSACPSLSNADRDVEVSSACMSLTHGASKSPLLPPTTLTTSSLHDGANHSATASPVHKLGRPRTKPLIYSPNESVDSLTREYPVCPRTVPNATTSTLAAAVQGRGLGAEEKLRAKRVVSTTGHKGWEGGPPSLPFRL
ncbi:hypothetical protein AGABI2DRAFT_115827 [Agaricus bisporus var. bisporus H97]|uniref:hypothetical protein n=1 Tax=Agaricus bisporus var. bisporus (strain H97 / ATCC MYA-4626 / FGSC 10389) TaxID=936046 RepID=UPI00029F67E2|nr:hypothetical protein AGABI2DRAFT_115827 [Agaricus bisporus var. bisporus H97]EKV48766.1 hypothetical protein AGABI2DRAFT_115827 [Agaricus bisporus var. bisporus H97]